MNLLSTPQFKKKSYFLTSKNYLLINLIFLDRKEEETFVGPTVPCGALDTGQCRLIKKTPEILKHGKQNEAASSSTAWNFVVSTKFMLSGRCGGD